MNNEELESSNSEYSDMSSDEIKTQDDKMNNGRACISQSTMDAIKIKERIVTESKLIMEANLEKQDTMKNVERLLNLSEQIKQIFNIHIGSQIYFSRLCI